MNEEKQKQLESIADRLLEKAAEMNSLANEIYKLIGTGRIDDLAKGGNSMKINIEATPQEIAELLQAIASSQEQKVPIENIVVSDEAIRKIMNFNQPFQE